MNHHCTPAIHNNFVSSYSYIAILLKHVFSACMIRPCKICSPPRHVVYYDYFSLLIHLVMCALCLVFCIFITNLSFTSVLSGQDSLRAPLCFFIVIRDSLHYAFWDGINFLDPIFFCPLGIIPCFYRVLFLIKSWKRYTSENTLNLSSHLTKNLVGCVILCWKNNFPRNIVNIASGSYCCQKFCWEVQSYYDSCFLYFLSGEDKFSTVF